ncbi:MAG TPA: efflux RND transporter periplasmic adaptor subunit [Kofleriaceae bacterium]
MIGAAIIGGVVWYLQHRKHASEEAQAENGSGSARAGAAGGGSGARREGGGGGGKGSGADRVVPVQIGAAEKKDLPVWIEGLGTVAAMQNVTVHVQVDGRLDKVLFTEGQFVKKGDLLAQIDPRPYLVQLHTAQGSLARDQAQLVMNQQNLTRYKGLADQHLVAQQEVEQYEGAVGQFVGTVATDKAAIESANLNLDYAAVRAPLDGIVGIRQVDAGNIVHQTDTNGLVVITAIDPAAVIFTVPQDRLTDVSQAIAHGDVAVDVYNRDGTIKLGEGKLAVLDNQINQSTASLRLKALVPNPDRKLWPNAFVKARMLIETRKDAIVIPAVALQRSQDGPYVYVVGDDNTAKQTPVTLGLQTGDVDVITKGLSGGEKVIIEGANQVRNGSHVSYGQKGEAGRGSGAPGEGSGAPAEAGSGSGGRHHKKDAP